MRPLGSFENPGYEDSSMTGMRDEEMAELQGREQDPEAFPEYSDAYDLESGSYAINDLRAYENPELNENERENALIEEAKAESLRLQIERDKQPLAMAELEHSDWMKAIEAHIFELRSAPEQAKDFWERFDEKTGEKDGKSRKNMEAFKYEILSHVAAQNFIKDLEEKFPKNKGRIDIAIQSSTPEEDIAEKVDFWVTVSRIDNGKEYTEKIPCRTVCIDISQRLRDRKENNERGKFLLDHFTNFRCPDDKKMKKAYLESQDCEKIREFYEHNPEGLLMLLSRFENTTILDTGKLNDTYRKSLVKSVMGNKDFNDNFLP